MTERPQPLPELWHVDRSTGATLRRVLAGREVIAYGKTENDARRIAHAGTALAQLIVVLELIHELIKHAPDFQGRETIYRLTLSAVRYAREGAPRRPKR